MTKVRREVVTALKMQVYYASRTHSQLSQFIGEIRKTPFADTRAIALGSRANLCINDDVKRAAKGTEDLNERCLDLQKKGARFSVVRTHLAGKERCPYLPPHDEPAKLETFRDHALSQPSAIEDLEDLGRRLHTCKSTLRPTH